MGDIEDKLEVIKIFEISVPLPDKISKIQGGEVNSMATASAGKDTAVM